MSANKNFAPGELQKGQLSQPGRSSKSKVQGLESKVEGRDGGLVVENAAARPIERMTDEGLNPLTIEGCTKAYSESITDSPAVDCNRGTVAGGSFGESPRSKVQGPKSERTDLCLWEDLEVGEGFYFPFASVILFKTGAESYGVAPNEPEFEWRTSGPGREPVWIIARASDRAGRATMQCRRCGCREETPCDDKRLQGPCGWIAPGLCSACLTDGEFEDFLQEVTGVTERGEAA